jgi:hypothetical protein
VDEDGRIERLAGREPVKTTPRDEAQLVVQVLVQTVERAPVSLTNVEEQAGRVGGGIGCGEHSWLIVDAAARPCNGHPRAW